MYRFATSFDGGYIYRVRDKKISDTYKYINI